MMMIQPAKLIPSVLFTLLFWIAGPANVMAGSQCADLFTVLKTDSENSFHQSQFKTLAAEIMMQGSLNVSRTKVVGRRFLAPSETKDDQIKVLAESNFRKAVDYLLQNFETLDINLDSAVKLNRILTEDLVPEKNRGDFNFRLNGSHVHEIDSNIGTLPEDFYVTWLNSPAAHQILKASPIEFAEIVHNSVMSLDSFPDGNGRLSRLLADLVLIKSNLAPAYYTSMPDYFDRGNSRSPVSRAVRKEYFHEIVLRGQITMKLRAQWPLTKVEYELQNIRYGDENFQIVSPRLNRATGEERNLKLRHSDFILFDSNVFDPEVAPDDIFNNARTA